MIELQKYSKMQEDEIFRMKLNSRDSRRRLTLYITVALLVSIIGLSLQVCYTSINVNEYNMQRFEEDLESSTMQAFVNFIVMARRTYQSREETAARYRIFKENYEMINKHNLHASDLPFTMAINQFADLTVDEFLELQSLKVPQHLLNLELAEVNGKHNRVEMFDAINEALPQYKNWYEEGKVSAPVDSSSCGASWAIVAASTLESFAVISGASASLTEFSHQQLIDCDFTNMGCDGGWMFKGYTSKYGIMTREDYPTSGKQGECLYNPEKIAFKNIGIAQEKSITNEKLKEIVSVQPVGVGIVANENLRFYGNGVVTEEFLKCSQLEGSINHGVTVIGYGKTEAKNIQSAWCKDYWIVKNSWGTQWGDKGFFKLCMDGAGSTAAPFGTCQINRLPTYPTMNPSPQGQPTEMSL